MKRFSFFFTFALVAACTSQAAAPSVDGSTSGSSTSGSTSGGPIDPCEKIVLPACPAPCPADYEAQLCGAPCFFNQGLRCGDALGKGMSCVDNRWVCETREAPGRFVGCDLTCRSLCTAMDAHGEEKCGSFIGYRWNGHACEGVDCSCVGQDCGKLFADVPSCEAVHQSCHPDGPNPCAALACGTGCSEVCTLPDCQQVFLACDAQGACTDRGPVCAPPPCPADCPIPPPECMVCQFGGVVCPQPTMVCILGSCIQSQSNCDVPEP